MVITNDGNIIHENPLIALLNESGTRQSLTKPARLRHPPTIPHTLISVGCGNGRDHRDGRGFVQGRVYTHTFIHVCTSININLMCVCMCVCVFFLLKGCVLCVCVLC